MEARGASMELQESILACACDGLELGVAVESAEKPLDVVAGGCLGDSEA